MNLFDEFIEEQEKHSVPAQKQEQKTVSQPQQQVREPLDSPYQQITTEVQSNPDTSIAEIFEKYYPRQNLDYEKKTTERKAKAAPFADMGLLLMDWITAATGGDVIPRKRSAMKETVDYMYEVRELGRKYDNDYNNRKLQIYLQDYADRKRQDERTEDKANADNKWFLQFNRQGDWHDNSIDFRDKQYQDQIDFRDKQFDEQKRRFNANQNLQQRGLSLNEKKAENDKIDKVLSLAQKGQEKTFPFAVSNTVHYIPDKLKGQFAAAVIQEAIDKGLLNESKVIRDIKAMTGINDTKETQQLTYVKDLFNRMPDEMSKLQTLKRFTVSTSALYDGNETKMIEWGDENKNTGKHIDW